MDLPSFIWLWRIAAWSMGLSLSAYFCLGLSGGFLLWGRVQRQQRPSWLRPLHLTVGITLVTLVLLLLSIGIVGTLGEYGHLGHSAHLPTGLGVVTLVALSAWSGSRIHPSRPWARPLHWSANGLLGLGFALVTWTGWQVVQKYLP
ncbi:MAG: DUF4079 domain-containing protein [Leptolyngbya sp.]|nr:DUF4079 domain-containing protein [Leptolyngbya sp.]